MEINTLPPALRRAFMTVLTTGDNTTDLFPKRLGFVFANAVPLDTTVTGETFTATLGNKVNLLIDIVTSIAPINTSTVRRECRRSYLGRVARSEPIITISTDSEDPLQIAKSTNALTHVSEDEWKEILSEFSDYYVFYNYFKTELAK